MARFWTSDPHFWHKNVIRFCRRPFVNLQHMHEELIIRWNAVVNPNDDVYVLGDFMFGPNKLEQGQTVLPQLEGRKILVIGNHDKKPPRMLEMGFSEVIPFGVVKIKDRTFKMSHYPYAPENSDEDVRFLDRRLRDDGHWLLHGHVHCAWKKRRQMINVGVDVWDFTPVSEDALFALSEEGSAPPAEPSSPSV